MVHYSVASATIENCFPILETFTDIESIVSLSQTCRAIHNVLIDEATRKIKVSHFEVVNFPVENPINPLPSEKNWRTAPARIPNYVTRALNAIHFPSLQRLRLDFPLTRRRNQHVIEDVACAAFPVFVTNLGYACSLECLHFDAYRLMPLERTGQIEALYDVLKQNLQLCSKLRELSVMNMGIDRNGNCLMSVALLQALIPTISKRREQLMSMIIVLSGTPSDPVYAQQLLHKEIDVVFDFFTALLSLICLERLQISTTVEHLDVLIRACDPIQQVAKPSTLTSLNISSQYQSTDDTNEFPSAMNLLHHFAECHQLRDLHLDLPGQLWRDCQFALKKLICGKPGITSLSLCFSCYRDVDGKMMKALIEFSRQESLHNLQKFEIYGLFDTNSEDFELLKDSMLVNGMYLSRCRGKKVGSHCSSGNLMSVIICSFKRQLI